MALGWPKCHGFYEVKLYDSTDKLAIQLIMGLKDSLECANVNCSHSYPLAELLVSVFHMECAPPDPSGDHKKQPI